MIDKNDYFLYRISNDGDAEIYGQFHSLAAATMSASLSMIKECCMILSGDLTKLYFFTGNGDWEYDILTDKGRLEFFDTFPHPEDYVSSNKILEF
jgi:hypothetical protein